MYKFAKKVANHEGFTLVELIVVIAILGILAGIAIPVYSGYIKKANQAADNMLLSAVNTALGAARAENGFVELSDADILVSSDKKIIGITCTVLAAELTPAELVAVSFTTYFGDNANTPLKYCTSSDDFEFHTDTQTFFIVGGGDGSGVVQRSERVAEHVESGGFQAGAHLVGKAAAQHANGLGMRDCDTFFAGDLGEQFHNRNKFSNFANYEIPFVSHFYSRRASDCRLCSEGAHPAYCHDGRCPRILVR